VAAFVIFKLPDKLLQSQTITAGIALMSNINQQQWQLVERPDEGKATCFELQSHIKLSNGDMIEIQQHGFLICYHGELRAWRNHCPHAGSPLDWQPGQFFSENGEQLLCHTHGALFDPLSGACLSGPCNRGLYPLELRESDEGVYLPAAVLSL